MKFIRWGSLVPQEHDIDENERGYHTPPVKKGFYAFPVGHVETFLLGGVGLGSIQNGRWTYLRDKQGNKMKGTKDEYLSENWSDNIMQRCKELNIRLDILGWDEKTKCVLVENKPKKFDYNGNIWCHLEDDVKRHEIISQIGSWILLDMNTYKKALKKEISKMNYQKAVTGIGYCKDHMEVYIESIQK